MTFDLLVALVGLLGCGLAALARAGIGSMLVPLFALDVDFKVSSLIVVTTPVVATCGGDPCRWRLPPQRESRHPWQSCRSRDFVVCADRETRREGIIQ
jgi:hypothetical protein